MLHRSWLNVAVLPVVLLLAPLCAQDSQAWRDPAPHQIQFLTVQDNVRLEVLDWGGSGRPLVLLAGLGSTAHVFDDFAPKLSSGYHVYGITRRGFGASSAGPAYDAYRLGDDVLAVLDLLKLQRPVLAGHSLGGEELSSVGSRHPDRVAGLIYLDASYQYALDNGKGTTMEEIGKFYQSLPRLPEPGPADRASVTAYKAWVMRINGYAKPEAELRQENMIGPDGSVGKDRSPSGVEQAIREGFRKFTDIRVPALAICAIPPLLPAWFGENEDPAVRAAAEALSDKRTAAYEKQAKAFEDGVPGARVIRLRNASHHVFITNEADVLREMRAFLATLK